jgi:23S rRNA pseudouridine1911/1915/1917 synthase
MSTDYEKPIGPWVRIHKPGSVHKITAEELARWVLHVDERVIVLNKSGELPCHPSKDGPWSSLAGAVREHFGEEAAHLVFRLDRETSGVVVFARDPATARKLQMAAQEGRYDKTYLAVMTGELPEAVMVDQPIGDDHESPVAIKSKVVAAAAKGQTAVTRFEPLACGGGFTLVRVKTETGRKHQIRVHAQWLGHWLVGDKIYGPDAQLFLDFVENGWTPRLQEKLLLARQALHCSEIDLRRSGVDQFFHAPMPADMRTFCRERMGLTDEQCARF